MIFRLAIIFLAGYVLVTVVLPDSDIIRSEVNWLQYSLERDLGIDRIKQALYRR